MLEEGQWSGDERNTPYTGWTSAYTVQSILIQLQVFLLGASGDPGRTGGVVACFNEAAAFECTDCPHHMKQPWPAFSDRRQAHTKLHHHLENEARQGTTLTRKHSGLLEERQRQYHFRKPAGAALAR